MDRKFNFEKILTEFPKIKRELMIRLSTESQNYFFSSFKNQGFDGQKWKEVQRRTEGTKAYKYPKKKGLQRRTSPILIGAGFKTRGGSLSRAVGTMSKTVEFTGGTILKMKVDVPYSEYINEGTPKMPKRQFVGQTSTLTEKQKKTIESVIDKAFEVKA